MPARVLVAPIHLFQLDGDHARVLRDAGCELVYPDRPGQMTEAELLDKLPGCAASLAGSEPYTPAVLAAGAAAGLKVVARAGVGYDAVDLAAATERGVAVTFAPGTNQDAVAEHVFMLMLAMAKRLVPHHTQIVQGKWPRQANQPVRGRTLGVFGLGRIGKAVADRGKAFGMAVVAHDPFADQAYADAHGIPLLPADDVFARADYVTLHMPMTPESRHMVNARTLGLMKRTAYLINTARGGIVNETDLLDALRAKRIAGAALDVLDVEPPPADHPLFALDNVIFTPHMAGVDTQSRDDMARRAAEAIVTLLAGEWPGDWVVNPQVRK